MPVPGARCARFQRARENLFPIHDNPQPGILNNFQLDLDASGNPGHWGTGARGHDSWCLSGHGSRHQPLPWRPPLRPIGQVLQSPPHVTISLLRTIQYFQNRPVFHELEARVVQPRTCAIAHAVSAGADHCHIAPDGDLSVRNRTRPRSVSRSRKRSRRGRRRSDSGYFCCSGCQGGRWSSRRWGGGGARLQEVEQGISDGRCE